MAIVDRLQVEKKLSAVLKGHLELRVGTKAWDVLNGRRGELIHKDVHGKLNDSEREELEKLERICGDAVDKAFPLPPADLESLILLRDKLRAEKAGHGE
jgi:hypothetical protein